MSDLQINLIVSNTILTQKGEFIPEDIYNIVKYKLSDIATLMEFIKEKIRALWKANLLTFTGFSYYVNN